MRTLSTQPTWLRLLTIAAIGLFMQPQLSAEDATSSQRIPSTIRFASYNVSLYGKQAGDVAKRLSDGKNQQASKLATVIQTIRPDVLLLCEVDHDADDATLNLFADQFLAKPQAELDPIDYPHRWSIPTNTGLLANADLDENGTQSLPGDAWGFGKYPGQYAMAVLSRFPLEREAIRTFQTFRWSSLPNALRPTDPATGQPFHSDAIWNKLRLSSKNHVDIPIVLPGDPKRIHLLACHPTPPVFDGPEDRNGCRNHDEIRFWIDYISKKSKPVVDDAGNESQLSTNESFVIAGDLNSDPKSGDSRQDAIQALLEHKRVTDPTPTSSQHGVATAKFGRRDVRVDYVLPSSDLSVADSGVVWPDASTKLGRNVTASDHRMVWVDIKLNLKESNE